MALESVRSGKMSKARAARQFGVPRTTLLDRLTGRVPDECRPGPSTALSKADEDHLAMHIVNMAKVGFPCTKKTLILTAKQLLEEEDRTVATFSDNLPGMVVNLFFGGDL